MLACLYILGCMAGGVLGGRVRWMASAAPPLQPPSIAPPVAPVHFSGAAPVPHAPLVASADDMQVTPTLGEFDNILEPVPISNPRRTVWSKLTESIPAHWFSSGVSHEGRMRSVLGAQNQERVTEWLPAPTFDESQSGARLTASAIEGRMSGAPTSAALLMLASSMAVAGCWRWQASAPSGLVAKAGEAARFAAGPVALSRANVGRLDRPLITRRSMQSKAGSCASVSNEYASTANIIKNIVGAGAVSLPLGASQLIDEAQTLGLDTSMALGLVFLLFVMLGFFNAAGFYLIGEACAATGSETYQAAWGKTLGQRFAWLPTLASTVTGLLTSVACAKVVGDLATDLASFANGIPFDLLPRDEILCVIAGIILFPLCLLPSLDSLAFASVLGLLGLALLAGVMLLRLFDGSYAVGGELYEAVAVKPAFFTNPDPTTTVGEVFGDFVVYTSIISNAFSAHFNAPAFFSELQVPASDFRGAASGARKEDAKLRGFLGVSGASFFLAGVIFIIVTLAGVITFGTSVQPSVINNYASGDSLAVLARLGLFVAVLFEFPLLERCFRETLVIILGLELAVARSPVGVFASVALMTGLACVPKLGLDVVTALSGSLGASLLTYVGPALMALSLRDRSRERLAAAAAEAEVQPPRLRGSGGGDWATALLLWAMMFVGLFLGLFGAVAIFIR